LTEKTTTTGKSAKSSSAAELDPKPAPPPDALALKLASSLRGDQAEREGLRDRRAKARAGQELIERWL
jgi:hypothetical protein